jgi:hypothetical protein
MSSPPAALCARKVPAGPPGFLLRQPVGDEAAELGGVAQRSEVGIVLHVAQLAMAEGQAPRQLVE